jgi:hypothetical protein
MSDAFVSQLAAARVIDLEQPRFAGNADSSRPRTSRRISLRFVTCRHRDTYRPVTEGPRSGSSGVLTMMEHSGTHIDAHLSPGCDLKMFGDVRVDEVESPSGFSALGIETVPPCDTPRRAARRRRLERKAAATAEHIDQRRGPRRLRHTRRSCA